MRKLVLGLIVFALGLGAATLIASPGAPARSLATLTGSVGSSANNDAFSISLSASTVAAGTYQFNITDFSDIHNFHLCKGTSCTGSNTVNTTTIPGTGSVSWTVSLTAGTYTYQCDAHGSMRKTLTVTNGPPPPPPVDHQLLYAATGTFKVAPHPRLINQFSPNGFVPTMTTKASLLGNPVTKTLPSGKIYGITNAPAHLACFPMTAPTQATKKVLVKNQFGQATLFTKQPNLLCVPSWKSLTGPPNKSVNTPPKLNHFSCYPVSVAGGAYKPPTGLKLRDQFAKNNVTVQVNPVPRALCLPTKKIVGTKTSPIINPSMHLLCFTVSKTPIRTPVWAQNQFGTAKMIVRVTQWLCLPSTKQVITG